jgi:hypothetical protein
MQIRAIRQDEIMLTHIEKRLIRWAGGGLLSGLILLAGCTTPAVEKGNKAQTMSDTQKGLFPDASSVGLKPVQ